MHEYKNDIEAMKKDYDVALMHELEVGSKLGLRGLLRKVSI